MPVITATWEAEIGGSRSEASPGKIARPYEKQTKNEKARRMAHMVKRP
jgi:hypothetical protein